MDHFALENPFAHSFSITVAVKTSRGFSLFLRYFLQPALSVTSLFTASRVILNFFPVSRRILRIKSLERRFLKRRRTQDCLQSLFLFTLWRLPSLKRWLVFIMQNASIEYLVKNRWLYTRITSLCVYYPNQHFRVTHAWNVRFLL